MHFLSASASRSVAETLTSRESSPNRPARSGSVAHRAPYRPLPFARLCTSSVSNKSSSIGTADQINGNVESAVSASEPWVLPHPTVNLLVKTKSTPFFPVASPMESTSGTLPISTLLSEAASRVTTRTKLANNDSLKRLGVDKIDLYYANRADSNVEVTATAAALNVSEYKLEQLEAANKVIRIDALQIKLSPWAPEVLYNEILDWCVKNNTALVAYSPLGRGFLTEGDFRRYNPRFQGENFNKNLELKSPTIFSIPGARKEKNLIDNNKAAHILLTKEEVAEIDGVINSFKISSQRYDADFIKTVAL
ncbi:uncharacterized protein UHO2_03606 [Ustilago hordei]|uniref:uncharacterized protein n=1 Tax=Ustilago hordei TaxID=120017 RepID=UPI001A43C009|nr:uncharacterized protein UHO2_03606 [Ustilago hordei]SYW75212.1 related to Aldo-keto reductase yakc [NADP+] [Ustilago hordei]